MQSTWPLLTQKSSQLPFKHFAFIHSSRRNGIVWLWGEKALGMVEIDHALPTVEPILPFVVENRASHGQSVQQQTGKESISDVWLELCLFGGTCGPAVRMWIWSLSVQPGNRSPATTSSNRSFSCCSKAAHLALSSWFSWILNSSRSPEWDSKYASGPVFGGKTANEWPSPLLLSCLGRGSSTVGESEEGCLLLIARCRKLVHHLY